MSRLSRAREKLRRALQGTAESPRRAQDHQVNLLTGHEPAPHHRRRPACVRRRPACARASGGARGAVAPDPALAARVAEFRRQNAALHEAFDPWLDEPVPRRLVDAARAPARASGRWRRFAPQFAAAATLVLGVALGWYGREALLERDGTPTTFARQAALTHVLYASDVESPGGDLGGGGAAARALAVAPARACRFTRRTSTASAMRSSAGAWSPATRSRPRCSSTRTPTSSACR